MHIDIPNLSWRHGIETISELLALREGDPAVSGGFSLIKGSKVELLYLLDWTCY